MGYSAALRAIRFMPLVPATGNTLVGGGGAVVGQKTSTNVHNERRRLKHISKENIPISTGPATGNLHTRINTTVTNLADTQAHKTKRTWARFQSRQLVHENRINRANQASAVALLAMGASQITDASFSFVKGASPIGDLVNPFSIVSSGFALIAAMYGYGIAVDQLAKNKKKQEQILETLGHIRNPQIVQNGIEPLKKFEENALEQTLQKLKVEEALLLQQRNSNVINIIASLLSIAAACLVLTGTAGFGGGILYYALLGSSILLPLIAMGYAKCSMNEKKYIQNLYALYMNFPHSTDFNYTIYKDTIQNVLVLLRVLTNADTSEDGTAVRILYGQLEELIHELEAFPSRTANQKKEYQFQIQACIESLESAFQKLAESEMTLMAEEIVCRLKIGGHSVEQLAKQLKKGVQVPKLSIGPLRHNKLVDMEKARTQEYAQVNAARKQRKNLRAQQPATHTS